MLEKCKECCSRLFCMSVAEVNEEDFETMANKKYCRKRVITNADRIRAMSDEALAKMFMDFSEKLLNECGVVAEAKTTEYVLEWLQQPAE